MSVQANRRELLTSGVRLTGATLLAAIAANRGVEFVQAASSTGDLDLSSYPEIKVTITDDGVQVAPDSFPSGYILLTVENKTSEDSGVSAAALIGPPSGMSIGNFLAEATKELTAISDSGEGGLPAIAYKAVIAGGPASVDPGTSGQVILKVDKGQWVVITDATEAPARVTAGDGGSNKAKEPDAAVTVTEVDFGFKGLDSVKAGPQIWKVENTGKQPHMLSLLAVPASTTVDQISGLFSGGGLAAGISPDDMKSAGGIFLQSSGTTAWPVLNLQAGHYAALCFVPDPDHGNQFHAAEGMVAVFDVSS